MASLRFVREDEPRLWTTGRIAERYGVPVHGIQYVMRSRRIRPVARAARLRVFTLEDLPTLRLTLESLDDRRAICFEAEGGGAMTAAEKKDFEL